MTPRRYLWNLAKLFDIAVNVVLLFDEHIQTFSRRVGLARRKGKHWAIVTAWVLNPPIRLITGQEDHFESAAATQGCIR